MTKQNSLRLNTKPSSFTVIGISSHENDYRLSWNINEQLNVSFTQTESIITDRGNEFTCFVYQDDNKIYYLVSNRCDNGFLLEKYKNYDFIFKVEDELTEDELMVWLRKLKSVPLISAVFPIPVNKQILQKLT